MKERFPTNSQGGTWTAGCLQRLAVGLVLFAVVSIANILTDGRAFESRDVGILRDMFKGGVRAQLSFVPMEPGALGHCLKSAPATSFPLRELYTQRLEGWQVLQNPVRHVSFLIEGQGGGSHLLTLTGGNYPLDANAAAVLARCTSKSTSFSGADILVATLRSNLENQ